MPEERKRMYIEDHEPFDCLECGGSVEAGYSTTKTFSRGEQVAIVYDVPVSECFQCGRTYTDNSVLELLQEMVRPHLGSDGGQLWVGHYDGPDWHWSVNQ